MGADGGIAIVHLDRFRTNEGMLDFNRDDYEESWHSYLDELESNEGMNLISSLVKTIKEKIWYKYFNFLGNPNIIMLSYGDNIDETEDQFVHDLKRFNHRFDQQPVVELYETWT